MLSYTKTIIADETATTSIPSGQYIRYINIAGPTGGTVSVYCGNAISSNLLANFQSGFTAILNIPIDQQCNNDVVYKSVGMGFANLSIGYDDGSSSGSVTFPDAYAIDNPSFNVFAGILIFMVFLWFGAWFFSKKR